MIEQKRRAQPTLTTLPRRGDKLVRAEELWQVLAEHPPMYLGRRKREALVTVNNVASGTTWLLSLADLNAEGFRPTITT